MSTQTKAPFTPGPGTLAPSLQRKSKSAFHLESRPAPAVYRPQPARAQPPLSAQTKKALQGQPQYQLSSPVWMGSGRQQIRVTMKGSPAPIGSVNVHYRSGEAYISDLAVDQSHRRHGVATMLMKAAMSTARQNGSSVTTLEANPGPGSISKHALVGMYQKLGFQNSGITQRGNPKMKTR